MERLLVPAVPEVICGVIIGDCSDDRERDGSGEHKSGDEADGASAVATMPTTTADDSHEGGEDGCLVGALLNVPARSSESPDMTDSVDGGDDDNDDDDDDDGDSSTAESHLDVSDAIWFSSSTVTSQVLSLSEDVRCDAKNGGPLLTATLERPLHVADLSGGGDRAQVRLPRANDAAGTHPTPTSENPSTTTDAATSSGVFVDKDEQPKQQHEAISSSQQVPSCTGTVSRVTTGAADLHQNVRFPAKTVISASLTHRSTSSANSTRSSSPSRTAEHQSSLHSTSSSEQESTVQCIPKMKSNITRNSMTVRKSENVSKPDSKSKSTNTKKSTRTSKFSNVSKLAKKETVVGKPKVTKKSPTKPAAKNRKSATNRKSQAAALSVMSVTLKPKRDASAPTSSPATFVLSPSWAPRSTCYLALNGQPAEASGLPGNTSPKRDKQHGAVLDDDHNGEDLDHDCDEIELAGTRAEAQSIEPEELVLPTILGNGEKLTAMSLTQTKRNQAAQALAQKRNTRCEALRWAHGEQLHAHCAFVALPNDTAQRSLRPWPSNRLTRTIFTGVARHSAPPNAREALAPREMLERVARADASRRELRAHAARAREKKLSPLLEHQTHDPGHCILKDFRPTSAPATGEVPWPLWPAAGRNLHALVPLMPRQLINVRLAPPHVDFGIVGAGSIVESQLVIENGNDVPVKVNVHSPQSCIKVLGDGLVYAPPHGKAEVTVTMDPEDIGQYNGFLRYILNDSHVFEAPVTAEVVLHSLTLKTKSLRFGFVRGCEEPWPQMVQIVSVGNPLQMAIRFEWIAVEKTCYEVIPRCGEVPPRGEYACEVRYRPNPDAQNFDAELLLASDNDNYVPLSCRLVAPVPNQRMQAAFARPLLKLPGLSLLRRRRFVVHLFNASFLETLFKAEDGGEGVATSRRKGDTGCVAWRLHPARGILPPRSVRLLVLSLRALHPGPLEFDLHVALGRDAFAPSTAEPKEVLRTRSVRKSRVWGRGAVLSIVTNVVCPEVTVSPAEIHLRRVPAGTIASAPLAFQNVGSVEATVRMVQTEAVSGGEWALSWQPERMEPLEEPLLLKAHSPPVELFLLFRPVDLASYEFLLPLQLNGGLGPAVLNDSASARQDTYIPEPQKDFPRTQHHVPKVPCVRVDATVSRKVLHFSKTEFNFTYDASDPEHSVTTDVLQVENLFFGPVVFWMPMSLLEEEPFSIRARPSRFSSTCESQPNICEMSMATLHRWLFQQQRTSMESVYSHERWRSPSTLPIESEETTSDVETEAEGEQDRALTCILQAHEACYFDLCFLPQQPGCYSIALPVFVGQNQKEDLPLLHLSLQGVQYKPTLRPSITEIVLQARPLNEPSEAKVCIEASHHKANAVLSWRCRHKFSDHASAVPKDCLEVVMEERSVPCGPGVKQLWAAVVFKATRPTGLRARIFFTTGPPPQGAECSVAVTAMADCSLLTTHTFLRPSTLPFLYTAATTMPWPRPSSAAGRRQMRLRTRSQLRAALRCGTLQSDEEEGEDGESDDWPDKNKMQAVSPVLSIRSSMTAELTSATSMTAELQALPTATVQPLCEGRSSAEQTVPWGRGNTEQDAPPAEPDVAARESPAKDASLTTSAQPADESRKRSARSVVRVCQSRSNSEIYYPGEENEPEALPLTLSTPQPWPSIQPWSAPDVLLLEDPSCLTRRRRGKSRCDSDLAVIDADVDSLGSSEDSKEDFGDETPMVSSGRTTVASDAKETQGDMPFSVTGFPLFPDTKDVSEYAQYMRRMQIALQEWLYDIAFRREYWCTIPDGFNQLYRLGARCNYHYSHKVTGGMTRRNAEVELECPFDINTSNAAFANLAGNEALDSIFQAFPEIGCKFTDCWDGRYHDDLPSNPSGSVLGAFLCDEDVTLRDYALLLVRRMAMMLRMMRQAGAVLPHVRPEYMLDYACYKVLYQRMSDEPETSPRRSNVRYSEIPPESPKINEKEVSFMGTEYEFEMETWDLDADAIDFIRRPILTKSYHRRINRQAWLDVTLQWARVYWMPKIEEEHTRSNDAVRTEAHSQDTYADTLKLRSRRYSVASAARYSEQELCLLAWLNERFDRVRMTLCPNADDPPPARFITTFDGDLADGVVLAAVTLDVCPFLCAYLQDIHPHPTNNIQAKHNAARLVSAWGALRLGFTVSVRDIVHPLAVKMLLLVAHLYNVLPGVSARHTLKLSASLATHATQALTLVNPSKLHMQYLAEFIGDPESFFSVLGGHSRPAPDSMDVDRPGTVFSMGPGQRYNLQVRFHARTFESKSCTLLLTGLMEAPNFGRSLAVRLLGCTDRFDVSAIVEVASPMLRPVKRVLTFPLPYSFQPSDDFPEFQLFMNESKPTVNRTFEGRSWRQISKQKVLRRLFFNQETTQPLPKQTRTSLVGPTKRVQNSLPQAPTAEVSVTLCPLTPRTRSFWIGCVSPTLGDFIVKVVSRATKGPSQGTLDVPLPVQWREAACTCGGRYGEQEGPDNGVSCPLLTSVEVPCRNAELWTAALAMFEMTLDDAERGFWQEQLDSTVGFQLMQWELEKNDSDLFDEYAHVFNTSVVYHVHMADRSLLNAPQELCVNDVRLNETVSLPVHVSNDVTEDLTMSMTLKSADGREVRNYCLQTHSPYATEKPKCERSPCKMKRTTSQVMGRSFKSGTFGTGDIMRSIEQSKRLSRKS